MEMKTITESKAKKTQEATVLPARYTGTHPWIEHTHGTVKWNDKLQSWIFKPGSFASRNEWYKVARENLEFNEENLSFDRQLMEKVA